MAYNHMIEEDFLRVCCVNSFKYVSSHSDGVTVKIVIRG